MHIHLRSFVLRIFIIFSLIFGILGLSCFAITHTLAMWIKQFKQIRLGYLDLLVKYSLEIELASILFVLLSLVGIMVISSRYKVLKINLALAIGSISIILLGTYAVLCLFIYLNLDEVLNRNNVIFQPHKAERVLSEAILQSTLYGNVEELNITTPDNVILNGWLLKNSVSEKSPLIIYFGGSAEEVSDILLQAKQLRGWSVALINYRGFGLSEGSPNQENVFNDSTYIYDYLMKRSDIDSERIVSMGYSLGTGVAINLSSKRATKGTVLVAPYHNRSDKIRDLFHLPYFPMSMILKQPFNSISVAPKIMTPLLCLVGDEDKNIPNESSMKLVKKWGGKTTTKTFKAADHFFLFTNNDAWVEINSFLLDI
ncbi:alpha/beta hydrolase [Paenibacillus sp. OAS669]|uniref:alpha/beta hydrolase n=1 Tax=Paenibacillus sp. OAS669 TaxID=2663821 RepID=UPI001788E950|nr:alpha/beta fold hydrolase [Paenibacillus sp. OAS669]MBE1442830.1 hypothetical protein [Paenibacillus sp. OAS669]